jgi:hypothetical protein
VRPVEGGLLFEINRSVAPVFTGAPPRYWDSPSLELRIGYTVAGEISGAVMTPLIYSDRGSTAIALTKLSNGCEMYSDASAGFGFPAACEFPMAPELAVTTDIILRNVNVPDGGAVAETVQHTFEATPEPGTALLIGAGLLALALAGLKPRAG